MDVLNLEKLEIRCKNAVETGVRLVIHNGAMEEEWEIPLSHPKVIEGNYSRWSHRSARKKPV